ncbi:hypothetical protein TREMEDRAFT_71278, partial [Tremella mesenterica DSM 1558]|uniref:uncharacterized protein n=1 Tax=Tremella mesenterica (strain ATCC 24925 / CBS 8224 / DSM 1558 / NBRC 9311 / NRRL Y-6157 / RJB 2259-6 / UBC 559-6) TaxID=578456 RepID=UPI0003F496F5
MWGDGPLSTQRQESYIRTPFAPDSPQQSVSSRCVSPNCPSGGDGRSVGPDASFCPICSNSRSVMSPGPSHSGLAVEGGWS